MATAEKNSDELGVIPSLGRREERRNVARITRTEDSLGRLLVPCFLEPRRISDGWMILPPERRDDSLLAWHAAVGQMTNQTDCVAAWMEPRFMVARLRAWVGVDVCTPGAVPSVSNDPRGDVELAPAGLDLRCVHVLARICIHHALRVVGMRKFSLNGGLAIASGHASAKVPAHELRSRGVV